jgi:hypothetical protein
VPLPVILGSDVGSRHRRAADASCGEPLKLVTFRRPWVCLIGLERKLQSGSAPELPPTSFTAINITSKTQKLVTRAPPIKFIPTRHPISGYLRIPK